MKLRLPTTTTKSEDVASKPPAAQETEAETEAQSRVDTSHTTNNQLQLASEFGLPSACGKQSFIDMEPCC